MKKLINLLAVMAVAFGVLSVSCDVYAADSDTVVALGADLTEEQTDTVLGLMDLTRDDLDDCTVIYVDNSEEHKYLDSYMDDSVIGSKALTSVKMTKNGSGEGINVTTKNINYCTTGMYRNALLTAGVEDRNVLIVAPTPVSGTAGLIGAVKAYEASAGKTVSENTLDTALSEMVTTGELSTELEGVSSEDIEAFIAWLKNMVASGQLDTSDESSIRDAIHEGEKQFGVTLTSDEEQQVVDLLKKLDGMGLNGSYLVTQAENLYRKYGSDLVNQTSEVVSEAVSDAAKQAGKSFWESIKSSFSDFIKGLF